MSTDGDRVYAVVDGTLYGISPADGAVQWQFTPPDGGRLRDDSTGLPVVCDDRLLIGGMSGDDSNARIRALNKRTGEQVWSLGVPAEEVESPVVGDGALYTIAELKASSGREYRCYCFA